jgi:hypothetical protein
MSDEGTNIYGHDTSELAATKEMAMFLASFVPDIPDLGERVLRVLEEVMRLPPLEAKGRIEAIGEACTALGYAVGDEARAAARTRLLNLLSYADN